MLLTLKLAKIHLRALVVALTYAINYDGATKGSQAFTCQQLRKHGCRS